MSVNGFTKLAWDYDDAQSDKMREGIKYERPNRTPRETLLKDRKTGTVRVGVKDTTPPNVLLGMALGVIPHSASADLPTLPKLGVLRVKHEPMQESAPPVVPMPRFYRWHPGAKPEECGPVW